MSNFQGFPVAITSLAFALLVAVQRYDRCSPATVVSAAKGRIIDPRVIRLCDDLYSDARFTVVVAFIALWSLGFVLILKLDTPLRYRIL